jgi:hypothetical protein
MPVLQGLGNFADRGKTKRQPLPQFAARFSAKDASPSDASFVCRFAECILTNR